MKRWMYGLALCVLIITGCSSGQSIQNEERTAPEVNQSAQLNHIPEPAVELPAEASQPQASVSVQFHSDTPKPSPAVKAPQPERPKTIKPAMPSVSHEREAHKTKSTLTLAELTKKYPDFLVLKGPSSQRKVALTFDDAPDTTYTPLILDVLKQHNVKATFFIVGYRAESYPAVVKRISREGHAIGNHSYNHANLPKLSIDKFQSQIVRTQNIIRGLIGYEPRLLRPPYGAINEEQIKWAASHHFIVTNWNVDSLDWKGLDSAQVSSNILSHVHPGSIILQHSGGGEGEDLSGTVKALPEIIRTLQAKGFQFVTVPELLNVTKSK